MALTEQEQREQDQRELDQLEYEKLLAEKQASEEPKKPLAERAKEATLSGLDTLGKGLDYLSGVTRTSAGYPLGVTSKEEIVNALKANPVSGKELLKRLNVPEGGSLSDIAPQLYSETGQGLALQKGGWADPTARGAAGVALETLTDPLTYIGFGAARAAKQALKQGRPLTSWEKLAQVSRPLEYGTEELGKKRYASAFKKIDKAATDMPGGVPLSETFMQQGMPTVNYSGMEQIAEDLTGKVGQQLGDIRKAAAQKGATVDMLPSMDKAMEQAYIWRQSPHPDIQKAGEKLDEITTAYLGKGSQVPVDKASKWATEANELGKKVFGLSDAPLSSEANAAIGSGIASQSEKAIAEQTPEFLQQYNLAKKQYSALANQGGQKQLRSLAKTEAAKPGISAVDAILLGLAGTGQVAPLAAKKSIEFLNSPYGRTVTGKGLYESGTKVVPILKRKSVWQGNDTKNEGKK